MAKIKRGRDAGTGRYIPVEEATKRKKEAVVETVETKPSKPKPSKTRKAKRK